MKPTYIVTYTGKLFDFLNPKPEDICIEDIARALACINRFRGHTRIPYSVAEHCVRASYIPVGNPLDNLLHDAAEAYIGDVPTPQKQNIGWDLRSTWGYIKKYIWVEGDILTVIYKALGLDYNKAQNIKRADKIMLATEIRDIMPAGHDYIFLDPSIEPLPHKIEPWPWDKAEKEFLRRYKELTKG